jgi:hypothetical protein
VSSLRTEVTVLIARILWVQETSIRTSTRKAVEGNEGVFPCISWAKFYDFLVT